MLAKYHINLRFRAILVSVVRLRLTYTRTAELFSKQLAICRSTGGYLNRFLTRKGLPSHGKIFGHLVVPLVPKDRKEILVARNPPRANSIHDFYRNADKTLK